VYALADAVAGEVDVTIAGLRPPTIGQLVRTGLNPHHRVRAMSYPTFLAAARGVDLLVYLTNRPPLPTFAKRSVLVVQFPFHDLGGNPVRRTVSRAALARYRCVAYSAFAAEWILRRWQREATILEPPVELGRYDVAAKRPLVAAVGRFFTAQSTKRQDALVEAFQMLPDEIRSTWRLTIAGQVGDEPSAQAYVRRLREAAAGEAIDIETDVPRERIDQLLREATLFWHAAGYGRRADQPEFAEHFGIATAEAMSRGAVPLVYDDGGQREVVSSGTGVRWTSLQELVDATIALAGSAERTRATALAASERVRAYDAGAFAARARALLLG
jgi:glycosyltransferase involved in cell wall biosynthesis